MPAPLRDTTTTLGANIRRERIARELNQRRLADRAHVAPTAVSEIETGRITDPRVSTLYAIAIALGVRMEDLMGVQRVEKTTRGRVASRREKTT